MVKTIFTSPLLDIKRCCLFVGLSFIRDDRNSFLLMEEKKIFAFKSYKRIFELEGFNNVKFFENFNNSCYIVIKQSGVDVKLEAYSSFGNEINAVNCVFDLSFPQDAVSTNGNRDTETNCVELIEGPLKEVDRTFFAELLACDLNHDSIVDVLLLSFDEKLVWVKYKNSFKEGAGDGYSIETITSTKGIIRGIKYCDGFLMVLDDLSVLTIFRLCPTTKLIKKKEVRLEGQVKCFRFHRNSLIYSNLKKIIFVDATKPNDPYIHGVVLRGIVCFSVVAELDFILAICRNQFFYHLPMSQQRRHPKKKKSELEELPDSDIELIPSVVKYLEIEEQRLLTIEQQTKAAQKLKVLLKHLMVNKNFSAGNAFVRFHLNLPPISDDTTVCKVSDQKLGSGFIEILIDLSQLLVSMSCSIAFSRHLASGVLTRMLKIDVKEKIAILMPAETEDDASNKMNLDLHFSYEVKGKTRLLVYPININQVIPFEGPRLKLTDDLDDCVEMIDKMKTC